MMRPILIALSLLALMLATLPLQARTITGDLTYRARVALAPNATMLVELVGPDGTVTELRQSTGGRQIPITFRMQGADTVLRLRAAILEGGQFTWISEPLDIPPGSQDVALGPVLLGPFVQNALTTTYACGREFLRAGLADSTLRLERGGDMRVLARADAADGERYSDGQGAESAIVIHPRRATVTWDGTDLPTCLPFDTPDTRDLTAQGNEPGWRLDMTSQGIGFSSESGDRGGTDVLPDPALVEIGLQYVVPGGPSVFLTPGPCHDTMTGMPYPVSVTVEAVDGMYLGCGGEPADLLLGDWRVTAIDGAPVGEGTEVTMTFAPGGELGGKAACNRFTSTYTLNAEGLGFGPAAATRMACAGVLMRLEAVFLEMLPLVSGFDVEGTTIRFLAGDRAVLTATR